MSELESRIRLRLKADPNDDLRYPKWPNIKRHYEQRIAQGMKLAYAVDQAYCNLSGSNRHDTPRGSTDSVGDA